MGKHGGRDGGPDGRIDRLNSVQRAAGLAVACHGVEAETAARAAAPASTRWTAAETTWAEPRRQAGLVTPRTALADTLRRWFGHRPRRAHG